MFYLTLIIVFSYIMIGCSVVYYVREFLIKFNASENGFLNVGAILSSVISTITAAASAIYAGGANDSYNVLRNIQMYDEGYVEMIRAQLPHLIRMTFVNLVASLAFLGLYILLRKKIANEIKFNLERPKKRWNWGKIS